MMRNVLTQLKEILGTAPLQVGEVVEVTGSEVKVELPGGAVLSVRGVATEGDMVFVRGNVIEGPAPSISVTPIDI